MNSEGKARPRYTALLQLLRTAETLWNASRVFFVQWDISPSQFNVLNLLHGKPTGASQIELSRNLIMHRSNVTGLVDRLQARGLVERGDDPRDRRVYRVVLTAEGAKLLESILPHYYQAAEAVWGELSIARTQELLTDLDQICANAERIANSAQSKSE
jgi:MarR family 2-MHQ and catechol resistance regulon transcriptional repressor